MSNTSKTSFLLLDSSLNTSVILLYFEGKIQCLFFESLPQKNAPPFSHTLAGHVEKLFENMQVIKPEISLQDLSFVICGLGPGSYTGIRASLSFAEGLRCSLNMPLGGICSLRCLKHKDPLTASWPRVQDARSGGLYVASPFQEAPIKVPSEEISAWAKAQPGILCMDPEVLKSRPELRDLDLPILEAELDEGMLIQTAQAAKTSLTTPLSPYYLGKGHTLPHLP